MLHAAFAGLVDGRHTASRFTVGNRYFLYSCSAFFNMADRSFTVTFLMLESDEPSISHEPMTSHSAM